MASLPDGQLVAIQVLLGGACLLGREDGNATVAFGGVSEGAAIGLGKVLRPSAGQVAVLRALRLKVLPRGRFGGFQLIGRDAVCKQALNLFLVHLCKAGRVIGVVAGVGCKATYLVAGSCDAAVVAPTGYFSVSE